MVAPYKDCTCRAVTITESGPIICHSTCKKYKEYKDKKAMKQKQLSEFNEALACRVESVQRAKKKRRNTMFSTHKR